MPMQAFTLAARKRAGFGNAETAFLFQQ